jgi:hypothetical protein
VVDVNFPKRELFVIHGHWPAVSMVASGMLEGLGDRDSFMDERIFRKYLMD